MIRRAGRLIDAFSAADSPPPRSLGAFMVWGLKDTFPVLTAAAAVSATAGTLEVLTALILGHVIDTALASTPDTFFSVNWALVVGVAAFFLVARPVVFGLSSIANAVVILPNVNPLVLARLHRWTLGQSVTFFDNDFAGRIAKSRCRRLVRSRMSRAK